MKSATLIAPAILLFVQFTPATCWCGQISSRDNGSRQGPMTKANSAKIVTPVNSGKLFYRNGNEGDNDVISTPPPSSSSSSSTLAPFEFVSSALDSSEGTILSSLPNDATKRLKPIDLPKHSPPREVLERKRLMLDAEMIIGRLAMMAFAFFLVGEVLTGLTSPQLLLNGGIFWM